MGLLAAISCTFNDNPKAGPERAAELLKNQSGHTYKLVEIFEKEPWKAGNVLNMYEFGEHEYTAVPKGYKPFYITHYGRHGARNGSGSLDKTISVFYEAEKEGRLSPKGKEFLARLSEIVPYVHWRNGELTQLGAWQQNTLAHNMFRNYPEVFPENARVEAKSTTVPRCILTMAEFCEGLKEVNPSLKIRKESSRANQGWMNPFSEENLEQCKKERGYNNPNLVWQKDFSRYCEEHIHPEAFFGRLFNDMDWLKSKKPRLADYAMTLFHGINPIQCNENISDRLVYDFYTAEELRELYDATNLRFYLICGPDTLQQGGRQWAFAKNLLGRIVEEAENDMATGEYNARLKFGHDTVVMALSSLLGIPGFDYSGPMEEVSRYWQTFNFPMALNLQFIFYKNAKGNILVKALYNEDEIVFPIDQKLAPYYEWSEMKAYLNGRIELARSIISRTNHLYSE